jgi:RNA polymerase sigma-70 factor, ECF subfamily
MSAAESAPPERYEAFVRLLVESEGLMKNFLRGLLPNWDDVDEVAQQTSLIAWRKFTDFNQGTNFPGWLLTIARFEALKYRRNLARSPLIFSDEVWELLADQAAETVEHSNPWKEALQSCLAKLDPSERELLLKAHSQGAKMNELARQLGRSEQAFYKTIQRLRSSLQTCIQQQLRQQDA